MPQVESNPYCRDVLASRMEEGYLSKGKVYDDITTYQPTGEEQASDGLMGGFPCQVPCYCGAQTLISRLFVASRS